MKESFFLLFGFLVGVVSMLKSQTNASKIKVGSELNMLCDCDQVELGDTMIYEYEITNVGVETMLITYPYWNGEDSIFNASFNHHVQSTSHVFPYKSINYNYVDSWKNGLSLRIYDPESEIDSNYIPAGKTFIVHVEDIVTLSKLKEGNNTIVVWPENINGLTIPDSLDYEVFVTPASSTNKTLSNIKMFPNPAEDYLYLYGITTLENEINRISILNLKGQVLKNFNQIYEQYDISDISTGYYMVNFELYDKSIYTKPLFIKK